MGLFNSWAEARGSSQHLLKKDAGFYPAHKDQRCNFRHINARSKQIHRNGNIWVFLIFETLNRFQHFF
jgi:hypothetical protein